MARDPSPWLSMWFESLLAKKEGNPREETPCWLGFIHTLGTEREAEAVLCILEMGPREMCTAPATQPAAHVQKRIFQDPSWSPNPGLAIEQRVLFSGRRDHMLIGS